MQSIVEIGLAFVDLIKAELEQAKRGLFGLCVAVGIGFAATMLLFCAIGLILYGIYLALLPRLGATPAVFVTALSALAFAGILLWIATVKARQ